MILGYLLSLHEQLSLYHYFSREAIGHFSNAVCCGRSFVIGRFHHDVQQHIRAFLAIFYSLGRSYGWPKY
ncbi:hypothetical protein [Desulfocastanea catecholica]